MNLFFRILYHVTRLVLGGVFIYASMDKIIHPQAFAQAVFNYQVLPGFLINLTALILPWLELILGVCLLLNRWVQGASGMVAILMSIFLGMIVFNLARGLDISCGCFSTSTEEGPMSMFTLLRDIIFLILAYVLVVFTFYKRPAMHSDKEMI